MMLRGPLGDSGDSNWDSIPHVQGHIYRAVQGHLLFSPAAVHTGLMMVPVDVSWDSDAFCVGSAVKEAEVQIETLMRN